MIDKYSLELLLISLKKKDYKHMSFFSSFIRNKANEAENSGKKGEVAAVRKELEELYEEYGCSWFKITEFFELGRSKPRFILCLITDALIKEPTQSKEIFKALTEIYGEELLQELTSYVEGIAYHIYWLREESSKPMTIQQWLLWISQWLESGERSEINELPQNRPIGLPEPVKPKNIVNIFSMTKEQLEILREETEIELQEFERGIKVVEDSHQSIIDQIKEKSSTAGEILKAISGAMTKSDSVREDYVRKKKLLAAINIRLKSPEAPQQSNEEEKINKARAKQEEGARIAATITDPYIKRQVNAMYRKAVEDILENE
jgi:hypothetical protein